MNRLRSLGLLFLVGMSIVGCGRSVDRASSTSTVDVPQTPIADQEYVGFCWAYSTVALIESDYKTRTGQEIRLSPEAIGFYRMATGIYRATRAQNAADVLALILPGGLEGYFLKQSDGGGDALDLVQKYGVVPEAVWSFKFDEKGKAGKVTRAIELELVRVLTEKLWHRRPASEITMDEIINRVMTAKGAFPSAPPASFDVGGKDMTAPDFLQVKLGFHPEKYGALTIATDADLDRLIRGIKRSLVRGVSVPIGIPVNMDRLHSDAFSGKDVDLNDKQNFVRDGAHAILITDFVNKGGKRGALSGAAIEAELNKPSSELDYLVVKNSWGTKIRKNKAGDEIGSKTGYFTIDREYLQGSANAAVADEMLRNIFGVVVPDDIASNPDAAEPVNSKISQQK